MTLRLLFFINNTSLQRKNQTQNAEVYNIILDESFTYCLHIEYSHVICLLFYREMRNKQLPTAATKDYFHDSGLKNK